MFSLFVVPAAGCAAAFWLRYRGLKWTWALAASAVALVMRGAVGDAPLFVAAVAAFVGRRLHRRDLRAGADLARRADELTGPFHVVRARLTGPTPTFDADGLLIGTDARGVPVRIPLGGSSGSHTLVVGATGSGKTVTQSRIAGCLIDAGAGAVVIDPKGDELLREQLWLAAQRGGRSFYEWTPDGPCVYNPYGHGGDTEIADKALAAEYYSEPHYLRQAQRYLGHAVRAMRAGRVAVTPATLLEHLDPLRLEVLARSLPPANSGPLMRYLDELTPRQLRDLGGTRDRLAIVAESDIGRWLDPMTPGAPSFALLDAVRERAVVLFRLESDRRPLLAQMLAAAIVEDLLTIAAELQDAPAPTVVVIDEFSALASERVARLLGRARSAGMSCVLATQELADLRTTRNAALLEQVLGNVGALVAHRQSVPDSAELVAAVAGKRGTWITSERLGRRELTRTRGRESVIEPDDVKSLPTGTAAVLVPARGEASIVGVHHPYTDNERS